MAEVTVGAKVRVPAGTPIVYTTDPASPHVTKNAWTVTVARITDDPPTIYWLGSGGYWKAVELTREMLGADVLPTEGKRCSRCGRIKPLTAFWADHRKPDGRQTRCSDCANRRRAETKRFGVPERGPMHAPEDRGYTTPCWIWRWGKTSKGYGALLVDGRNTPAHRWLYEQANGAIPAGFMLDHLCRQRDCVNPEHLEAVTNAENIRRGLRAKLTYEDVEQIRRSPLSQRKLAAIYGVTEKAISNILHGRSWVAPGGGPEDLRLSPSIASIGEVHGSNPADASSPRACPEERRAA